MNIFDSPERAACATMALEHMGRRPPIERCNAEARQWSSMFRFLVAAIALLTFSGCEGLMFTDKVNLGQWDFAASALNTCLSSATNRELQRSDKQPSKEIVTLVVADCGAERLRYEHLAEGVDERHRAIAVQPEESIAADIQLGRSLREGLEAVVSNELFFTAKDGAADGFDARVRLWDRCTDSAAPFFAKGNPFDDPNELAHEAAWASYYCGRFSVNASGSAQDLKIFLATFELVKAHELERRPLVAKSIEAMQAKAQSQ